jgi:hypothetical protein
MYKGAGRRTGGSQFNGYAHVARKSSNPTIERAAAHTDFVRKVIWIFGPNPHASLARLSDYDLALLIDKMLDGHTHDRALLAIGQEISFNIKSYGLDLQLAPETRLKAENAIPLIIKRWEKYRAI